MLCATDSTTQCCVQQIALHNPGDVVSMADHGIAAAPDMRTLIDLKYSQVGHKLQHAMLMYDVRRFYIN